MTHQVTDSHTTADFLGFMKRVALEYPDQLHVILDNSAAHGTPDMQSWLAEHPRVHFHYTPTSASWLNQVEGFFGILGKQSLGATSFESKRALVLISTHYACLERSANSVCLDQAGDRDNSITQPDA